VQRAEQIPEFGQCADGNHRRARHELETDRVEHPRGQSTHRLVRQPNMDRMGESTFVPAVNPNGLPKQRVPPVKTVRVSKSCALCGCFGRNGQNHVGGFMHKPQRAQVTNLPFVD
jgi:hypothetical protein